MKIGIVQLNSNNSIEYNLKSILEFLDSAVLEKPDIIFFPENSLFFRIDEGEKIQTVSLSDQYLFEIKKWVEKNEIAVHLTTALQDNGKIFNASVLISKATDQSLLVRNTENTTTKIVYKKIHLFDIELIGQKPIKESDVFEHGEQPEVFEFKGVKFGSSICYDVRFSELYKFYAQQEVDIILVPSAFLVKTGMAHWHTLLRARAIESQCYVLAPAQFGNHKSTKTEHFRQTYGHSLVISPWGDILAEKIEGLGLIYVNIDLQQNIKVRTQIPMKNHRRL